MAETYRVRLFVEVIVSAEVRADHPDQALAALRRHIALQRHEGYEFVIIGIHDSDVRRIRRPRGVARTSDGTLP